MKSIYVKIQNVIEKLNGMLLLALCILIAVQVFCRYVIFYSLPWSEEVCRYLYIWLVLLGGMFGVKEDTQIRIDAIDAVLKNGLKRASRIAYCIISLVATVSIGIGSIPLIVNGVNTQCASLPMSMMVVYLIFPIGMLLISVQLILKLIELCTKKGKEGEI